MGKLDVEHPELLKEWNYKKNGNLRPEDCTTGSHKKVWWQCDKGHEWQAAICDRCNNYGCPYCSGRLAIAGVNDLATVNPDLAKEWHPTKNGDLLPENTKPKSSKKVWWICNKNHEWQAAVASRTAGNGCPYCSGKKVWPGFNDLATVNPDLAKEWHPTKNGKLTPEDVTVNNHKKVWWKCDKGHEWQVSTNDRNQYNTGCPYCSNKKVWPGFNDLATVNPDLAKEWHPTKNGDLTPRDITAGSNKKVWWKCDKGHEWQATVVDRSHNHNCPYCTGRLAIAGVNDLATIRPDLAKEWHPTKNKKLKPEDVTTGSSRKVWWKCDKGHEWQAAVNDRCDGHGCPYCMGRKAWPGFNDLASQRPDLAKEWHPTKNKKLKPEDVTTGSSRKVWWKCDKGHEWQATVGSRTAGNGCPYCSSRRILAGFNDLATANPGLAKEWHPTKNGNLTPDQVMPGSKKKVWWKCDKGHEWQATVGSRTAGNGCPICYSERQTSFAEQTILYYLNQITPAKSRFKVDDKYEADIFLPEMNTAIEYDGWYWHEKQGEQERDKRKNAHFANSGIRLIRIKEVAIKEKIPADEQDIIYCFATQSGDYLSEVLDKIFQRLEIVNTAVVDLERDAAAINEQYIKSSKENSLLAQRPDLAKEWHPTKNGNLTPEDITVRSGKTIWWQCDKGHEWQATAHDRSAGSGCPVCAGRQVLTGFNDLATVNPDLAKEWHPTKNGDLTPRDVTAGSHKKIWWKCNKGHEWQATVEGRNSGGGCPYCSNKRLLAGFNDLATVNPDLAKEWHPTKNGDLTPRDVTAGSHKKIWWKCKKGHEWQATVGARNDGLGCPFCAGQRAITGVNDLATINPELAAQWHPTKNGKLTPDKVMPGSSRKVWWLCDKGHEWQATVGSRSQGRGCPYCSGRKVLAGYNDLATTNPEIAAQWHPTKNGNLHPRDVTAGSGKTIWWQCDKGHEWQARVTDRTHSDTGCPTCRKKLKKKNI